MKEVQDKIQELLNTLGYEEQNTLLGNIRNENREKRMKEIYFYESRAAEIRRSMDKI